jgi:hypothetical protein
MKFHFAGRDFGDGERIQWKKTLDEYIFRKSFFAK